MKILVAGGAGFLGSHLCEFLLKKRHYVFCIDNLLTGKKENIIELLDNKNFKFRKVDVIKNFNINEKDKIF